MDEVTDEILDILEKNELTVADSVAILEMIKYNILRAFENQTPEGVTLQ